jgi:zinc-ribbon domain
MYCPSCGKDNSEGSKFCASCGTNLEVISRALYSRSTGVFTRAENALDQVITHYSERVFRNAPGNVPCRRISDSWKVLGQGILTVAADFILFWLMLFVVFPVKLLTLLLFTPFKLLTHLVRPKPIVGPASRNVVRPSLAQLPPPAPPVEWRADSPVSAVEHTTEHLQEYDSRIRRQRASLD